MKKSGFYTQILQNKLKAAVLRNTLLRQSDALLRLIWSLVTKCTISTGIFTNKVHAPTLFPLKRLFEDGEKRVLCDMHRLSLKVAVFENTIPELKATLKQQF